MCLLVNVYEYSINGAKLGGGSSAVLQLRFCTTFVLILLQCYAVASTVYEYIIDADISARCHRRRNNRKQKHQKHVLGKDMKRVAKVNDQV